MNELATPVVTVEIPEPNVTSTVRVLVVDEDPMQQRSVRRWLQFHPSVEVHGFSSPEEALTSSNGFQYDVCLIDQQLDGMSGIMLGAMIRALNPGVRLILMTAARHPATDRQAIEHGFYKVIGKPLDSNRHRQTILGAITEHRKT
jgi:DNA-binding NtrC family response regulator